MSEGETSNFISIWSRLSLIEVVKGTITESISLIVIRESSIFFKGIFDESLNVSLRWIILVVLGLMLKESISVSFALSNLTVTSLVVSF